jgi:hypothetical protein
MDEACGSANELRQQVERLLAAQPQVGSFLKEPALAAAALVNQGEPAPFRNQSTT